jgi:hypothetical protein
MGVGSQRLIQHLPFIARCTNSTASLHQAYFLAADIIPVSVLALTVCNEGLPPDRAAGAAVCQTTTMLG